MTDHKHEIVSGPACTVRTARAERCWSSRCRTSWRARRAGPAASSASPRSAQRPAAAAAAAAGPVRMRRTPAPPIRDLKETVILCSLLMSFHAYFYSIIDISFLCNSSRINCLADMCFKWQRRQELPLLGHCQGRIRIRLSRHNLLKFPTPLKCYLYRLSHAQNGLRIMKVLT